MSCVLGEAWAGWEAGLGHTEVRSRTLVCRGVNRVCARVLVCSIHQCRSRSKRIYRPPGTFAHAVVVYLRGVYACAEALLWCVCGLVCVCVGTHAMCVVHGQEFEALSTRIQTQLKGIVGDSEHGKACMAPRAAPHAPHYLDVRGGCSHT